MHRSHVSRSGQTLTRVVLPMALFVLVVGGIAWVTQYLPSTGSRSSVVAPGPSDKSAEEEKLLKFESDQAVFDKEDPNYAIEVEKDEKCHYDFPFENVSGKDLDLGVKFKNCTCTNIELRIGSGSEPFKPLAVSEKDSERIPAGAKGMLRFNWAPKNPGPAQLLGELWCQYQGVAKTRRFQKLAVKYNVQPPIMFRPDKMVLGAIDARTVHFSCWSATRKGAKLTVKSPDLCFAYEIQPMTASEMDKLQKDMEKSTKSHVLSAFHVKVNIVTEKDGHYLDQGHLEHKATFFVHDGTETAPVEVAGPVISGTVTGTGDVTIVSSSAEDNGKFRLEFRQKEKGKRSITLTTEPSLDLKVIQQYPDKLTLPVTLTKVEADSTPQRTVWKLEVSTENYGLVGPVPDNSFILLQTSQNRRVRIPLIGTVRP